ncbi:MAG: NAD(P)-dependent oxidoreductase [Pseudomonadota bacterium]
MKTFPMFLQMAGRDVLILGGGEQAAQKCRLLRKTEARITVQAPALDLELDGLASEGAIVHDASAPSAKGCSGKAIVFVATGCPGLDAALHDLAKAGGALVNVVDQPSLCDALTPSIVDRDPVVVAIGTEGTAPVLARQIKTRVEEMLEPRLGDLAALAGRLRDAVAMRVPQNRRRAFWRWVFLETPRRRHASGGEREAARLIKSAIDAGGAPDSTASGLISFIPSDGVRDHLTLAAVQRLQEADLILHDPNLGEEQLELARRDAERLALSGPHAPADPAKLIAEEASDGARVVVLHAQETPIAKMAMAVSAETLVEHLASVSCTHVPMRAKAHA